jgi:hypothetical protein
MIRLKSDAEDWEFVHLHRAPSASDLPSSSEKPIPLAKMERVVLNALSNEPDQYPGKGQESASHIRAWLL